MGNVRRFPIYTTLLTPLHSLLSGVSMCMLLLTCTVLLVVMDMSLLVAMSSALFNCRCWLCRGPVMLRFSSGSPSMLKRGLLRGSPNTRDFWHVYFYWNCIACQCKGLLIVVIMIGICCLTFLERIGSLLLSTYSWYFQSISLSLRPSCYFWCLCTP